MTPTDAFEELFDREQLLLGLPARRASTLLFLIESRTARLTLDARRAMQRYPTRGAGRHREREFIEAFALGREPPVRPTIQDLDREAPHWAPLVARNPRVQAALAHSFGEKYRLARRHVRRVAAALGLDDPRVRDAFEQLYERPLDSVYADRLPLRERLRWSHAELNNRIEGLSPFWTAYALTLTETVGSTIVALPIAVAAVGPMPAAAILVLLGIVNVLTVAYMADALARSGTIRYGNAYIGRVVADLLGRPGAAILSVGVIAICVMGMQADYIGFSSTLTESTGVPVLGWVVLLFAVELAVLRRGSIDATVTSALLVGALNIVLVLVLCALAFAHVQGSNLTRVELPFTGDGFDRDTLALAFGVTFTAYFGHLSVSNCARVVLGRDPSGRTLVRGVVWAQITAIVLYVLFVVAVTGAVAPEVLVDEAGTALAPLADEAGAAVLVLGGILVVLGMGMASIHSSLALFYLVRERLPSHAPLTLVLPRRGARAVLEGGRGHDRTTAELTYLGVARGKARLRLDLVCDGRTHRVEGRVTERWEPFGEPALRELADRGLDLAGTVLAARDQEVRAELQTSMRVTYEGDWDGAGVSLAGILALTDTETALVAHVLRHPDAAVRDVAEAAGVGSDAAGGMLEELAGRGLVSSTGRDGERRYAARIGRRRGGRLSPEIWDALRGPEDAGLAGGKAATAPLTGGPRGGALMLRLLDSERGRFLAGISPVVAVFAVAAWQATTGAVSLADVLSFLGVIIVALLAGVFPVLLIVAARAKGEVVAGERGVPVGRWVLGTVYFVAVGGVALHGLVLWEDPLQRIAALLVTLLAIGLTVNMARNGTFARRATFELRLDEERDTARFAVVSAGRPAIADIHLVYDHTDRRRRGASSDIPEFSRLRTMSVTVQWANTAGLPTELKFWAHRVTADEESEPLEIQLALDSDGKRSAVAFDDGGEAVVQIGAVPPAAIFTVRR